MDRSDEIVTLLKDIQRMLAEQAEEATNRWQIAVVAVVVCAVIAVVYLL